MPKTAMKDSEDLLEIDTAEVRAGVESGEYFKEAMRWYSAIYHAPLAERCYFIVVMGLALANTIVALLALLALLPLSPAVPFTLITKDIVNEVPSIRGVAEPGEPANPALMRYFVNEYVVLRESYDVDKLSRSVNAVRYQSDPSVFNTYRNYMSPGNPNSPITRFQRHTQREINIISTDISTLSSPYTATVQFEALEKRGGQAFKSRFTATMAFRYQNLSVNQETYEVSPMAFQVVRYDVKQGTAQ